MTALDQFYRAYYEYTKAVSGLKIHDAYKQTLKKNDKGKDSHNGIVKRREIDPDWVEAIENVLPNIDMAIRENRRFITQQEEVVPIEKTRKITSESVRHLAQHTNLIAKVEGDKVTPESILNIFREESFAIYENRFLRTLIDNLIRFVEIRYNALTGNSETAIAELVMERQYKFEQENTQFRIEYKSEYRERESFDINEDLTTLSDFERVVRIRKILSDFAATPLMRELKNAEPVRPPITRTNLLLKDPNFRAALDIWTYIETYTKTGYTTVMNDADGNMEPEVQDGIYDAIDFLRFSLRLKLSPPLNEMLRGNYDAEEKAREREAQRKEEERQQREKMKIAVAVERERVEQESIRKELAARYEREKTELKREWENTVEKLKTSYENHILQIKEENEANIAKLTEMFENRLSEQTEKARIALEEQKTEFETVLAIHKTEHESELKALENKWQAVLSESIAGYDAQLEGERAAHSTELSEMTEKLNRLNDEYKNDAQVLRRQISISEKRASAAEGTVSSLTARIEQQEKEYRKLKQRADGAEAKYERKYKTAEERFKAKLERQERSKDRKIEQLEKKLKKALKKCPYKEVMAEGEE